MSDSSHSDLPSLIAKLGQLGVFDKVKSSTQRTESEQTTNPSERNQILDQKSEIAEETARREYEDAAHIITMIARGQDPYDVGAPLKERTLISANTVKAICVVLGRLIDTQLVQSACSGAAPFESLQFDVPEPFPLEPFMDWLEAREVAKAITETHGNQTAAARLLGITYRAIRHQLENPTVSEQPIFLEVIRQFPARSELVLDAYLATVERNIISSMLIKTKYNRTEAARQFGISFRSMRYRLKRLGIEGE